MIRFPALLVCDKSPSALLVCGCAPLAAPPWTRLPPSPVGEARGCARGAPGGPHLEGAALAVDVLGEEVLPVHLHLALVDLVEPCGAGPGSAGGAGGSALRTAPGCPCFLCCVGMCVHMRCGKFAFFGSPRQSNPVCGSFQELGAQGRQSEQTAKTR